MLVDIFRNGKLGQTRSSFPRQVPNDFEINVVRKHEPLGSPRFFDGSCKILRYIEGKSVIPAIIEPARELLACIDFHDVDVEFALVFETGTREVAAAEKTNVRVDGVFSVDEVEFGVETLTEMELDFEASFAKLSGQVTERGFVFTGGDATCQLSVEVFGDLPLQL